MDRHRLRPLDQKSAQHGQHGFLETVDGPCQIAGCIHGAGRVQRKEQRLEPQPRHLLEILCPGFDRGLVVHANSHQSFLKLRHALLRFDPFLYPGPEVRANTDTFASALQRGQRPLRVPVGGRIFPAAVLDRDVHSDFARKLVDGGERGGVGRGNDHLSPQALRELEHLSADGVVRSERINVVGHHLNMQPAQAVPYGGDFLHRQIVIQVLSNFGADPLLVRALNICHAQHVEPDRRFEETETLERVGRSSHFPLQEASGLRQGASSPFGSPLPLWRSGAPAGSGGTARRRHRCGRLPQGNEGPGKAYKKRSRNRFMVHHVVVHHGLKLLGSA